MDTVYDLGRWLFGFGLDGDSLAVHHMVLRAVIVYGSTVAMVRLGKRHFMSRDSAMDMIVGIVLGAVVSRAIVGSSPFLPALVAGATLVAAHWTLSLAAFQWRGLDGLLKGDARVIAEDSRTYDDRLAEAHMTKKDLWQELRGQGVSRLEQVSKATLERSGRVSVLKVPVEVILPEHCQAGDPRTITIQIHV